MLTLDTVPCELQLPCTCSASCETENNLWGNVSKQTLVPMRFVLAQTGALYVIVSYYTIPKFFSCPQQLNRWPCHWLTDWLTFTFDITEWPERLVTFETFDQSDEETWPDQHFDKSFLTILDKINNFQQFYHFWQF